DVVTGRIDLIIVKRVDGVRRQPGKLVYQGRVGATVHIQTIRLGHIDQIEGLVIGQNEAGVTDNRCGSGNQDADFVKLTQGHLWLTEADSDVIRQHTREVETVVG